MGDKNHLECIVEFRIIGNYSVNDTKIHTIETTGFYVDYLQRAKTTT